MTAARCSTCLTLSGLKRSPNASSPDRFKRGCATQSSTTAKAAACAKRSVTCCLRLVAATGVGGWRHFATTRRAVRSPSDLKGLKIRTTPSAIQQEFVRALGATPTPVAWSELYTAFGAGVIDGAKNTINDVMISNNNEHIRFITLDGHVYMSGLWWYSERTWRRTPAAYVPVIEQGIEALRQTTIDLPPKISQGYADAFVADGGELIALSETELAAFKAAARRVRAWYQERQGDRWLDALDEAVADCERVAG